MLHTPVLLILFNRPGTTSKVFEAIRQAQPRRLFIAADGPRNEEEKKLTEAARRCTENIDWPCTVLRNYAEENMGCKMRPYSAISWAFEQTEELIILEDDCLPHPDFFTFCSAMLEKYRHNESIFNIGGTCLKKSNNQASYYFTRHTYIWGWASWRRAWQYYDLKIKAWNTVDQEKFLTEVCEGDKIAVEYWKGVFDTVYKTDFTVWDYQWLFTSWINKGCSIVANENLVSNIGFGPQATHTFSPSSTGANLPTENLGPIIHPPLVKVDTQADRWVLRNVFIGRKPGYFRSFSRRVYLKMKRIVNKAV